ncbi:hypothetical protein [Nocardiopsis suaedae]|uniref:DUF3558 domain-containing protein n=1 Tax=Nocardiopsis suaedae TaxID=3018444 RepID=A0ABT4TKK5_9ACTN|nr:hypothetical protein [Nocardiopsis suaedae]MDA2805200.1 hypothetical protein [Nocardiopsis suaedae]
MPPARPARKGAAIGATVAVTLIVAGSLTAAGVYAYDHLTTAGPRTVPGLPTDPCGALGEDVLDGLGAEPDSQGTMRYETGCTWEAEVDGREATLNARWIAPYAESDADLVDRYGDEEAPRDTDSAYEQRIEQASEPDLYAPEEAEADSEERDLGLGEESVLVLTTIDDGLAYADDREQRASVVVREGEVVGTLTLALSDEADEIDIDDAEDLLGDAAAEAFG